MPPLQRRGILEGGFLRKGHSEGGTTEGGARPAEGGIRCRHYRGGEKAEGGIRGRHYRGGEIGLRKAALDAATTEEGR